MKTRLDNHIAIVTGSSSGNGRAIALIDFVSKNHCHMGLVATADVLKQ